MLSVATSTAVLAKALATWLAFGAVVAQPDRDTRPPLSPVEVVETDHRIDVRNGHYRASITRSDGRFVILANRSADTLSSRLAFGTDDLRLTLQNALTDPPALSNSVTVRRQHDFYTAIEVVDRMKFRRSSLTIRRILEFTRSPHVYETVEIFNERTGSRPVTLSSITWRFQRAHPAVTITRLAPAVQIATPKALLGGWDRDLAARRFESPANRIDGEVVSLGDDQDPASIIPSPIRLRSGESIILSSRITIPSSAAPASGLGRAQRIARRLYPSMGLLWDESGRDRGTFINWNAYAIANELVPVRRKYRSTPTVVDWLEEDTLVRLGIYLIERLRYEGGWLSWPSWGIYPDRDVFTAHARALPFLAYLWSYLTIDRVGDRWVHEPSDADLFYAELQGLLPYYGYPDSTRADHFRDRLSATNIPYISYSASAKESNGFSGPRGVLNTHAHALHLAWIMKDAAMMRGRREDHRAWGEIIQFYHQGTRELFARLYPGHVDPERTPSSGLVDYSLDLACVHPRCGAAGATAVYNTITFEGIVAGYREAGEYEPEFIDVIERAALLDYEPWDARDRPAPELPFVAAIVRTFPLALAFAGDTVTAAGRLEVSNLSEIATYAAFRFREEHALRGPYTPPDMIVEGDWRKLVRTNRRFVSDWIPGYWDLAHDTVIPHGLDFRVSPASDAASQTAIWTAYRTGNRIELLARPKNPGDTMRFSVQFEGKAGLLQVSYQDYDSTQLHWTNAAAIAIDSHHALGPRGVTVHEVGELELIHKRIATIELIERPAGDSVAQREPAPIKLLPWRSHSVNRTTPSPWMQQPPCGLRRAHTDWPKFLRHVPYWLHQCHHRRWE